MITIFINHSRDEIRKFLNTKKLIYVNIEEVNTSVLEDLARQQNIFDTQKNYLVFEYPKNKDEASVLANDFLINSPNNFYFECLCAKSYLPKRVQDFIVGKDEGKKNSKKDADVFLLSDTFFSGNTQKTWLTFQKLKNQKELEELHGTYVWAIKTVLMARDSIAKKTLSSYVTNKISPKLIGLEKGILNTYYKQALELGINAHLGKVDFEKGFEKLILQVPRP